MHKFVLYISNYLMKLGLGDIHGLLSFTYPFAYSNFIFFFFMIYAIVNAADLETPNLQ